MVQTCSVSYLITWLERLAIPISQQVKLWCSFQWQCLYGFHWATIPCLCQASLLPGSRVSLLVLPREIPNHISTRKTQKVPFCDLCCSWSFQCLNLTILKNTTTFFPWKFHRYCFMSFGLKDIWKRNVHERPKLKLPFTIIWSWDRSISQIGRLYGETLKKMHLLRKVK